MQAEQKRLVAPCGPAELSFSLLTATTMTLHRCEDMTANSALKNLARKAGLFGAARKLYRSISPSVRRHLTVGRGIYGKVISRGDLVFDIGCNLGQKSVTFLRLGARVIALEPNPNCAPVLELEFGNEPRFTLVRKAVGAAAGRATNNFANTYATASLRSDWHALKYTDGELQQLSVDVTTLKDLIASYGEPDFCKIDVEGFEPEVVKGLDRPLKCSAWNITDMSLIGLCSASKSSRV
jgi:FkbM family methyltransferase